jgi:RimJ/RimL family protein N-acetyltransferase
MSDLTLVQPIIHTSRLELHHVPADRLIVLLEEPENEGIYEGCSYTNPHRELMDHQGPLRWRVPQVKEDASLNKWFVRWMVLRSSREIVGSISFHNAPNVDGMVEIGLGVNPDFQGRGFAKEALVGMWSWVVEQPGVTVLRYTVSKSNVASVRIIQGFEFAHVGVQIDETDGPEEIYEMSAREFTRRFATTWCEP